MFEKGALVGVFVSDGEWWRLVTAMVLHASVLHLGFNTLALYWLGSIVEQAIGTWRFLLVYFAAGLAGSAGALVFSSAFAITVGASGAIFGIMGALMILEYHATGSLAGQAMGLIVINLALTFPNISIDGHLGGLVAGIIATFALVRTRGMSSLLGPGIVRRERRRRLGSRGELLLGGTAQPCGSGGLFHPFLRPGRWSAGWRPGRRGSPTPHGASPPVRGARAPRGVGRSRAPPPCEYP